MAVGREPPDRPDQLADRATGGREPPGRSDVLSQLAQGELTDRSVNMKCVEHIQGTTENILTRYVKNEMLDDFEACIPQLAFFILPA
jgi:hypothetical protein